MEKDKTTFQRQSEPKSQPALNYAKDYNYNELPQDWKSLINAAHDPDIKQWFTKFQFRQLYIYELNRLFNSEQENSIKFSQNTVKVCFIDKEKVLITDAVETSDYISQLNQRNTTNINDSAVIFENTDTRNLIFQNGNLNHDNKIYAVSINQPVTEENLNALYIINSYVEPWKKPNLRNTKSILVTKINNFRANNGYPIIVKINKQLDSSTKITGIKIKYPQTMLFGNIKLIGQIDGINGYTKTRLDDNYINFPLLSMPIETEPNVRILQWWFSEAVLPWKRAKDFLTEKSVLDLIKIGGGSETRREVIKNARVTDLNLGYYRETKPGHEPLWPLGSQKHLTDKELWKLYAYVGAYYISTTNKYADIEIEIKDTPTIDSLQKLLLEILSDTYNYYRGFDGAKYNKNDGTPVNKMAKIKEKFERQKAEDIITYNFKKWELDNPNYVLLEQVKNFKKIIIMLSKYILSKLSINTGFNDDNKILLPYYFELISKPMFNSREDMENWEFKDCKVLLKSAYFDFTKPQNIKTKNSDLSQNFLYQLDENQYNWLSINNELEANSIPSLLPPDWKLSDGEFAKYFTNLIIKKSNLEDMLNLYGNLKSNLYSKVELFNIINQITNNNEIKLNTEKPLQIITEIEISGIYGYGNYDFILITADDEEIEIKNINLFSKNEKISLIKIEI